MAAAPADHTAASAASVAFAALAGQDTAVPSVGTLVVAGLPLDSLGVRRLDIQADHCRIDLVVGCTFRIEEWMRCLSEIFRVDISMS